jgi:hypothetical protein
VGHVECAPPRCFTSPSPPPPHIHSSSSSNRSRSRNSRQPDTNHVWSTCAPTRRRLAHMQAQAPAKQGATKRELQHPLPALGHEGSFPQKLLLLNTLLAALCCCRRAGQTLLAAVGGQGPSMGTCLLPTHTGGVRSPHLPRVTSAHMGSEGLPPVCHMVHMGGSGLTPVSHAERSTFQPPPPLFTQTTRHVRHMCPVTWPAVPHRLGVTWAIQGAPPAGQHSSTRTPAPWQRTCGPLSLPPTRLPGRASSHV